jgi:cytochrome d ubiquinol oxidase subunit I
MLAASGLTVAFLIAGISALQLLRNPAHRPALGSLRIGLIAAAVIAPLQFYLGDAHGLNTLENQPAKIAAIEGVWHTERGAPLTLLAIPNEKEQRNDFAITVPHGASIMLRHDLEGEIQGIDAFGSDHPPVLPVFFAFRVMVGIGVLMLATAWFGAWRLRRGGAFPRWFLRVLAAMTFSGWIGVVSGWMVAEIGRQPWLIRGVLKSADAAATTVPGGAISLTLATYALVYLGLMISFMVVITQLALKDARAGARPERIRTGLTQAFAA